jgi:di/tricarboxylate transporter
MDVAWISVLALAVTVLVSCTSRLNAGVLAIALAWVIAIIIAPLMGQSITVKEVLTGFPSELFVTLTGITLLFTQAQVNGTLGRIAQAAVFLCRGNAALIPLAFFCLATIMSAIGAGSIATAALVAPMAMAAAANARIPAFLMAMMVGHGAVAGGMSPFAMTGVIANGLMNKMNLPGQEWPTFFHNLAANALVAVGGYLIVGGWRNRKPTRGGDYPTETSRSADADVSTSESQVSNGKFDWQHKATLFVISLLIAAVLVLQIHVGMAAFAAVAVLTLVKAADEKEAIRAVPWSVILMVCGVTVLVSLIERTGGIERITGMIAAASTPRSLPGMMAFTTGVVSVYSSTSGVVLPAFLPAVPSLVEKVGGVDPMALAASVNIGGNLVDVSPLSTIGALCIACAGDSEDRRVLFNKLLAWGLSMSLVAAVYCTLLFSPWPS